MKNKKVELDLETVLRAVVVWLVVGALAFSGVTGIQQHVASLQQTAGALCLIIAVYLLMPQKDESE